jgi:flagellar hook-length control protein FliK
MTPQAAVAEPESSMPNLNVTPPSASPPPMSAAAATPAGKEEAARDFQAVLAMESGDGHFAAVVQANALSPLGDKDKGTEVGTTTIDKTPPAAEAEEPAPTDPASMPLPVDLIALMLPQAITPQPMAFLAPSASGAAEAASAGSRLLAMPAGVMPPGPAAPSVPGAGDELGVPPDALGQLPEAPAPLELPGELEAMLTSLAAATEPAMAKPIDRPAAAPAVPPAAGRAADRLAGNPTAGTVASRALPKSEDGRGPPEAAVAAPDQVGPAGPLAAALGAEGERGSGRDEDRRGQERPPSQTPTFAVVGASAPVAESRPAPATNLPPQPHLMATPQQQVAPVVIALAHTPQHGGRITVALRPEQLGRVEIHLNQQADGGASVHLVAERPETLALLQRDALQLDRALGQAGITLPSGGLSFALSGGETGSGRGGQRSGNGRPQAGGDWLEGEGGLIGIDASPRRLVLSLLDIAV